MSKINVFNHKRSSGNNTVKFSEIITQMSAIGYKFRQSKDGKVYLNVISSEEDDDGNPYYLSIGLADSVELTAKTPQKRLEELVKGFTVFTGTTDKTGAAIRDDQGNVVRWFSFGVKNETDDAEMLTLGELDEIDEQANAVKPKTTARKN